MEKGREIGLMYPRRMIGYCLKRPENQRYAKLYQMIRENRCKKILEIGVFNGYHAQKMILAALETPGEVFYYGFDMFEDMTEVRERHESSPHPPTMARVYGKLSGSGVTVELFKGDTRTTLPEFVTKGIVPDIIFIDGGHSIETVNNDWNYAKQMMGAKTIVIFDDYLSAYKQLGWGCNPVIDNLREPYKAELLFPPDKYGLRKVNSDKYVISENNMILVIKNGMPQDKT